ncbi:MAG: CsbD family protein [Terriglobales bacterium]
MDKDRVEGKVKDIAGRTERQVGEWTGDEKAQVKGAAKQVEGKVQNAWGKAKDEVKKRDEDQAKTDQAEIDAEERRRNRAVNE